MRKENQIVCPSCGTEIDVTDVISHQLEAEFKKKYNALILQERQKYEVEAQALAKEKRDLEKQRLAQEQLVQEQVSEQIKQQRLALEKELKLKLEGEQAERLQMMESELKEKTEQVRELNRAKAEVEKIKREKEELKEILEAEAQQKLNQQLAEEKDRIRKSEQEKNELALLELRKQLEDQKRLTEEMKRRQEQGSMQLQGEVQELGIEDFLTATFPLDEIKEIKKGERGADCLQIVHTRERSNCGTIYYESKRTKEFSNAWIEKFKADIRVKGANIGVLVTEVYPKGMDRMGLVDGVWVCSYDEFKGLTLVLRESIIQLSVAMASQENKGDKMVMLYDFLTSNEFKMQVEAIVEGFTQMQMDLLSEKRALEAQWKKREKQIEKVLLNTTHMYQSIRGIAGAAIQPIQSLELPGAEDHLVE